MGSFTPSVPNANSNSIGRINFGLVNLDILLLLLSLLDRRAQSTAGGTIPQPGGPELFEKLAKHESECKPASKPTSRIPQGFCFRLLIEFLLCAVTDYGLEVRAK